MASSVLRNTLSTTILFAVIVATLAKFFALPRPSVLRFLAPTMSRTPIWFIAHGGPPTVVDYTSPAREHWVKIADAIKTQTAQGSIRGIVFVSAHWQADPSLNDDTAIEVNTDETNPLIYDFYGFPDELYKLQFRSHNPAWLHQVVMKQINEHGKGHFKAVPTKRGLDHGVWVPLLPGFGPDGEGLPPLVQISLPVSQEEKGQAPVWDGLRALRLGQALSSLREQGIAVIGGGQPVHNLREMRKFLGNPSYDPGEFGRVFSAALTEAILPPDATRGTIQSSTLGAQGEPKRWEEALKLFDHRYFRKAHPTVEHLLPALVCLGAAHDDEKGVETFNREQLTMGWSMYRWN